MAKEDCSTFGSTICAIGIAIEHSRFMVSLGGLGRAV